MPLSRSSQISYGCDSSPLMISMNHSFFRHLFGIWKASCFKLIWHEFMLWIFAYSVISALYRNVFAYDPKSKQYFELICIYASRFGGLIPMTFLTGFYVSQVVNRWWDQFMSLPWPDRLALKLVSFCPGTVSDAFFDICFCYN